MQLRDYKDGGYGLAYGDLPKSGIDARQVGSQYYFTGDKCKNGHIGPRYTAGGNCVICTRMKNGARRGQPFDTVGPNARAHLARTVAAQSKLTTYTSPSPCKSGHVIRFTASNNCVQCSASSAERSKEKRREARLKKVYGLDFREIDRLLSAQKNACAICEVDINAKTLHVDHCHSLGHVRGLLCQKCNQGLGLFGDNIKTLLAAAEYVKNAY